MPVDKFGRTDGSNNMPAPIQRLVVSGGVTLSQVTDTFLQRNGGNAATGDLNLDSHKLTNVGNPADDQDAATKHYVDSNVSGRVLKNGDTMTGNLLLTCGSDHIRSLGCNDLTDVKTFHLYLGDEGNQIKCRIGQPILMQATTGVLFRHGRRDVLRIGKTALDNRIEVYQDILLEQHYVRNLHDPENAQDAATKRYVDSAVLSAPRKTLIGYIPPLETNISCTGFVATASTAQSNNHLAYGAFNNLNRDGGNGTWVTTISNTTGWLQIQCPGRVKVWRIALKARSLANRNITEWDLSASNDGLAFTVLLASTSALLGEATSPSLFEITTAEAYQYYRFNIKASTGSIDVGVQYMQLYVYDI